jgi:D-alanyl-D-alanine carboxypeptidase
MGLLNTQFSNPHGLSNALNVSSALDLIKLSLDASKNRFFNKIMNTL